MKKFILALSLIFFLSGCQSARPMQKEGEAPEDVRRAVGSVVGGMSGRKMSDEDVDKLLKDVQNDKEAQSAINSITNSMDGQKRIKYSPATGKRYSADLEYDPETGVKLEYVD